MKTETRSRQLLEEWPFDPFRFKKWSKADPRRLAFVAWSRLQERWSRTRFDRNEIPLKTSYLLGSSPLYDREDTAVTPEQATRLMAAIGSTEHMTEPVAEVGCYRGVTTCLLARNTIRKFICVDPFSGYGGAEKDLELFKRRVADIPNVIHLRRTSGEAAQELINERLSFVFIDAVHDYVNTHFDSIAWSSLLRKDGLIAFHDTDERMFAGTRRAVFELLHRRGFILEEHVPNLVILRKSA